MELQQERSDILGRFERSVEIEAPLVRVWEMLALDRMPEWKENCEGVSFTSPVHAPPDKYRVGAMARFIDKHSKMDMTITESLENKRITYTSSYSFVRRIDLTYVLESTLRGTKLTCIVEYDEVKWGILGRALFKLMLMASGNETQNSLENMKRILEK